MIACRELRLSMEAATFIERESRRKAPAETGGILVGHLEANCVHVAMAVGPGPRALHAPTCFVRDGTYAQVALDGIFARSRGRDDYIGEWHSHPAPVGPSHRDRKSLAWIARHPAYDCPSPILLICQRRGHGWLMRGYHWIDGALVNMIVTNEARREGTHSGDQCNC